MAPQVSRLLLLFGALVAVFVGARSQMVPKSFGATGFYPSEAPAKLGSRPMSFAGKTACMECHEDIAKASFHVKKGVACETCHGPSKGHADNWDQVKPPKPATRAFCIRCHAQITGRPASFPQIDPKTHNPDYACTECHEIHPKEAGS